MTGFLSTLHLKAFSEPVTQQGKPELQAETATLHDSTVTNAYFTAVLRPNSAHFYDLECSELSENVFVTGFPLIRAFIVLHFIA